MFIKHQQTVLKIAKILNDINLQWAIGASLMLQSLNLVDEVRDIDILVVEKDIDSAIAAIETIAVPIPFAHRGEYLTRSFNSFKVDGIGLDVMSGFRIKHNKGVYEFPMNKMAIVRTECIKGVDIPFTSVEDWYVAYMLMSGREAKVRLIEAYFKKEGICHPEILNNALKQKLPTEIRNNIKKLFAF